MDDKSNVENNTYISLQSSKNPFSLVDFLPDLETYTRNDLNTCLSICHICNLKLKASSSITRSKLHFCRFCQESTCDMCSPLKIFHSERGKSSRMCIACFHSSAQAKILKIIKDQSNAKRRSSILAIKKEQEEIRVNQVQLHNLIEEIDIKNKEISEYKIEIEALYRELNFNSRYTEDFDGKALKIKLNQELLNQISDNELLQKEIIKSKKALAKLKEKQKVITSQLEELEQSLFKPPEKHKIKTQDPRLVLRDQIVYQRALLSIYSKSVKQSDQFPLIPSKCLIF